MEKFTKLKDKNEIKVDKDDILYSDDNIKIVKFEDWSILKTKDSIICIPYLIETNQVILRYEYIPTFKYINGDEYYITVVAGGVEFGETPQEALLRELEEEAGLVLREDYDLEEPVPLFVNKGVADKYYFYVLPLNERDYHEVVAKGDGSVVEKKSKSVKVDVKYISSIKPSDLVTGFMIMKLKEYLNL